MTRQELDVQVNNGGLIRLWYGVYAAAEPDLLGRLAALDLFMGRGLLDRARHIEGLMKDRLLALQAADNRIGDVRGRGAMIAVEFVKPDSADPDAELTNALATAAHAAGVIVLTAGTFGNVVRFLPPLAISDELLSEGLDVLAGLLSGL
ncbi:aminotransferase class III-fold pyridoxal phosphate-dependent enzyme [Candidatus Mycobacterium methanotrophicum]|uniref:aminotransferase class III-fold pyridoxal phosphate-dependent enzyme n=1 Tax=Candidatus Mycobacterium methanotrophicum TaxID=2943498 RepID=UPI001C59BB42